MVEEKNQEALELAYFLELPETETGAIAAIGNNLKNMTWETAEELAKQARATHLAETSAHASGGKKPRTAGKIFLQLCVDYFYERKHGHKPIPTTPSPKDTNKPTTDGPTTTPGSPQPGGKPLTEEEISELYEKAAQWPVSDAGTLKITIVGRPEGVQTAPNGQFVSYVHRAVKLPGFPKGIQAQAGTLFLVVVGMKQWRKVEASLSANENNRIMIEGYPVFHSAFKGIVIYASTTGISTPKVKEPEPAPETKEPEPALEAE